MMTAILILLLLGLVGLCATLVRHAIPTAIASFAGWVIWVGTRDVAAAIAGAIISAGVSLRLLEMAGSSSSGLLRRATITIELVAVVATSAAVAFVLFAQTQSPPALAITLGCAIVLGVGLVFRDRVQTH